MLSDEQEQLLGRILASSQFSHAESLKRILRYVCEHSGDHVIGSVKESEIAVNALGRPKTFDPKSDPIVRVSIAGIRERLRSYFATQGLGERLRLEIPKGQYRAVYTPVAEPATTAPAAGAMKFWRPHLAAGVRNVCVYSELLFFRDDRANYVRNLFVNDLSRGLPEIQQHLPEIDISEFRPSYHFLSAGEVHCLLFLCRHFQDLGSPLEMRNARFCSWGELRSSNLVLLGSSRTNRFVEAMQNDLPFQLKEDHIVNRNPGFGESPEYRGRRYQDGKLERVSEYAVITRLPGLSPERSVTVVSANHGRAVEAAGSFVTRDDALRGLLAHMSIAEQEPVPSRFQVLLRVELVDFDEDVVHVDYVTHRVF